MTRSEARAELELRGAEDFLDLVFAEMDREREKTEAECAWKLKADGITNGAWVLCVAAVIFFCASALFTTGGWMNAASERDIARAQAKADHEHMRVLLLENHVDPETGKRFDTK